MVEKQKISFNPIASQAMMLNLLEIYNILVYRMQ